MARLFSQVITCLIAWRFVRRHGPSGAPDPTEADRESEQHCTEPDPSGRTLPRNPRAEAIVALLLVVAAILGFGFTAVYAFDGHDSRLLGLAIGGAFMSLAAAAIVAGRFVATQETSVEERSQLLESDAPAQLARMVTEGGEGISRRTLLAGAAGIAGVAVTTAAVTPLASLGPRLTRIHDTPWHHGVRFVDSDGRPYLASQIQIGSLYTALPEGASWEQLGAPLLVVRLPAHYLHLPAARADWAIDGIVAYSKICPHAACAISLYRYPTFAPTSDAQPAFTCPCHYSTFLPGEGGKLLFGPAGRPLPQLPVMVDSAGHLRAHGGFDEDVGPAWLDVRRPRSI